MAHYVDNKKFFQALVEHKERVRIAKEQGVEAPPIPNYIGHCISQIAHRLATLAQFANYTFKEDMIGDGIENCILYMHNFDPEKTQNPFAYFTQITYYAFLRRIDKEKRHLYVKNKVLEKRITIADLNSQQIGDTSRYDVQHVDIDKDYIANFTESYEKTLQNKREKRNITKSKKNAEE
jgi:hypothetical protein